jgi:hypothetical protein
MLALRQFMVIFKSFKSMVMTQKSQYYDPSIYVTTMLAFLGFIYSFCSLIQRVC